MFEKVNPSHPDKVADRIAGAIVDLAYSVENDPKIAVEVLIGHGECTVIMESSVHLMYSELQQIVNRIIGRPIVLRCTQVKQDVHLAENQSKGVRCGDNGIFKGVPVTDEQNSLTQLARAIYEKFPYDGKYLIHDGKVTLCQSHATDEELNQFWSNAIVNPLGYWDGGTDVDTGATNRKLGSDMGDSVTGGGLHGKDLSKADVSVNIYAWLMAQRTGTPVEISCSIGDSTVDGRPYSEIVEIARDYINSLGGFERFAEWGLIR